MQLAYLAALHCERRERAGGRLEGLAPGRDLLCLPHEAAKPVVRARVQRHRLVVDQDVRRSHLVTEELRAAGEGVVDEPVRLVALLRRRSLFGFVGPIAVLSEIDFAPLVSLGVEVLPKVLPHAAVTMSVVALEPQGAVGILTDSRTARVAAGVLVGPRTDDGVCPLRGLVIPGPEDHNAMLLQELVELEAVV